MSSQRSPVITNVAKSRTQPSPFRFGPVEAPTLKDRISLNIRRAILQGHLPPGTRIVESALAKEMNVAQTSVREGLMDSVNQGFLVKYVNRETVVRKLDAHDIEGLFRVRIELEGLAVELSHPNANEETLAPLYQLVDHMREAGRSRQVALFYESDIEFHRTLWRLSRNEFLERSLVPLSISPVAFFLAGLPLPPLEHDFMRVAAEHEEILDTFNKGSARACRNFIVSKIKGWRDEQRQDVRWPHTKSG
jgi:DNA-binding GntR family transcriptional regulator